MNNFLRSFACLLLLFLPFASQAQITHSKSGNTDSKASQILAQSAKAYSQKARSCVVTMVNINSEKKETARQNINILYSNGRYCASFQDQQISCDGSTIYHWNKKNHEVTLSPLEEMNDDENLYNPAALLANYSKNFKAKYIRDENGSNIIDLTPIKQKSYYKIRLIIDAKSHLLNALELHNYDSSCGKFLFSKYAVKSKVKDADFIFDTARFPKEEVIDMR